MAFQDSLGLYYHINEGDTIQELIKCGFNEDNFEIDGKNIIFINLSTRDILDIKKERFHDINDILPLITPYFSVYDEELGYKTIQKCINYKLPLCIRAEPCYHLIFYTTRVKNHKITNLLYEYTPKSILYKIIYDKRNYDEIFLYKFIMDKNIELYLKLDILEDVLNDNFLKIGNIKYIIYTLLNVDNIHGVENVCKVKNLICLYDICHTLTML